MFLQNVLLKLRDQEDYCVACKEVDVESRSAATTQGSTLRCWGLIFFELLNLCFSLSHNDYYNQDQTNNNHFFYLKEIKTTDNINTDFLEKELSGTRLSRESLVE